MVLRQVYKGYRGVFLSALALMVLYPFFHQLISKKEPKLALIDMKESAEATIKAYMAQIGQEGANLPSVVKKELDAEFQALLEKLIGSLSIDRASWDSLNSRFKALKAQDRLFFEGKRGVFSPQKSDMPVVQKAKELLWSYNIRPDRVTFEIINDPQNASHAFAGQCIMNGRVHHFMRLNLAELLRQETKVQEAWLRHEIMHLCNYDPLFFDLVEQLFAQQAIAPREYWKNSAYRALNKHAEYRADLMASVHNLETAQALLSGLQEHMSRYDDSFESSTHPSCKQRYAAVENLMRYMQVDSSYAQT